jgi:hypothetical protein
MLHCSGSVKHSVRLIFRALMTDKVAIGFNLDGRGTKGKTGIRDLYIMKAIVGK